MNLKNKLSQVTLYVRYCYLEEPYWEAFINHYYSLGVRNINVIIQSKKDIDSFHNFFYPKDLSINIKRLNKDIRPNDTFRKIDLRKEKKNTKYLLVIDVDEFLYFLNPHLELDKIMGENSIIRIPWLMNPISNINSPNSGFYGTDFKSLGIYERVKRIQTCHRLKLKNDFLFPLSISVSYNSNTLIGDRDYYTYRDGLVLIHNWARSLNDSLIKTLFSKIKNIKTHDSDSVISNLKRGNLTIRLRYLAFLDLQPRYITNLNISYRNKFRIDKELDLLNRYINERELQNYYQKYQEFKNNLKKNFDKLPIFPPNNNIINQINYLEKKKYFFD